MIQWPSGGVGITEPSGNRDGSTAKYGSPGRKIGFCPGPKGQGFASLSQKETPSSPPRELTFEGLGLPERYSFVATRVFPLV